MKLVVGACLVAAALGLASAFSAALYAVEASGDTNSDWLIIFFSIAAATQAATSIWLVLRRTVFAGIAFVLIELPLAGIELVSTVAVHYGRNYLSIASATFGIGALIAISIARWRLRSAIR